MHPLFSLSTKTLLSLAYNWGQGELNVSERKVLFLALLKSTDKVIFRTAASPSPATVQKYMARLLEIANWFHTLNTPALRDVLTEFAVNRDTRFLENIGIWFDTWEENKVAYHNRYVDQAANEKLKHVEDRLRRLIKSPAGDQSRKWRVMIEWALDAAKDPETGRGVKLSEVVRGEWISTFCLTTDADIWNANKQVIASMIEYFEAYLDVTGYRMDFSFEVLSRARELQAKATEGLNFHLGIPGGNIFTIVEDDIETHNKAKVAAVAPAKKPEKADFAGNTIAYIRAHAAWLLSVSQQEKDAKLAAEIAARETVVETNEKLAAIDATEAAENAANEDQLELDGILKFSSYRDKANLRKRSSSGME
jgi:hypothetical protein